MIDRQFNISADRQLNRWADKWTEKQIGREMDKVTDKQTEIQTNRWTLYRQKEIWEDRHTDEQKS